MLAMGSVSSLWTRRLILLTNWHNLRLELTVYTDNDRAIRLYKRCGFEQEGVLRKYAFRDGGYIDALTMARFKSG